MKNNTKIVEDFQKGSITFSVFSLKELTPEQIEDFNSGKQVKLEENTFIPENLHLKNPPKTISK